MKQLIGRRSALVALAAAVFVVVATASSAMAHGKPQKGGSKTERVILFSSDGMRPDLMWKYAHEGLMPNYRGLIREGVVGRNGLRQAFPPNTGVGWYVLSGALTVPYHDQPPAP